MATPPFKLAAKGIKVRPEYRLRQLDAEIIDSIKTRPAKLADGPKHFIRLNPYMDQIKQITAESSMLERMGAMLFLSSYIEGRVRAMYRDRHAVMHGLPHATAAAEAELMEMVKPGARMTSAALEKDSLYRQICHLRYYEDIDADTYDEMILFTEVRNAMVHNAMYLIEAFQVDVIHALVPMIDHLRNMRNKVKTRVAKERALHGQSPFRADYFGTLSVGQRIKRDTLFTHVAGSPSKSIAAPMSFGRPLYVIAQGGKGAPQVKIGKEELETHDVWEDIFAAAHQLPVFRKVNVTDGTSAEVEYVGRGVLVKHSASRSGLMCDVLLSGN